MNRQFFGWIRKNVDKSAVKREKWLSPRYPGLKASKILTPTLHIHCLIMAWDYPVLLEQTSFNRTYAFKYLFIALGNIPGLFGGMSWHIGRYTFGGSWQMYLRTSKKGAFFRNFRDISTKTTSKITFYCIFIKKYPKNFENSAQKFLRSLRCHRKPFFLQFFCPPPWQMEPPCRADPPPNNPGISMDLFGMNCSITKMMTLNVWTPIRNALIGPFFVSYTTKFLFIGRK